MRNSGAKDANYQRHPLTRCHPVQQEKLVEVTQKAEESVGGCSPFRPQSHDLTNTFELLWETSTGRELLAHKGHTGNILSAVFSSDGQRLVTGSEDNSAKVWDAETGRELFTFRGHRGWVRSVAFSAG